MRKRIAKRPEWLKAGAVADVYSVSGCISGNFADYIAFWKHNGYWLFDSPAIIEAIAVAEGIDLSGTELFYYEAHDREYEDATGQWTAYSPEPSFTTHVQAPTTAQLEGFDVVTFCAHTSPECSPLSCCSLANLITVNEHCLFPTFADAKDALERGFFDNSEPGPYRIIAVHTVGEPELQG